MVYGDRGGKYLSEGGGEIEERLRQHRRARGRIPLGRLQSAPGSPYRSYGEFVHDPSRPERIPGAPAGEFRSGPGPYKASVPGLEGRISPYYPPFDLSIPDGEACRRVARRVPRSTRRTAIFPRLSILRLGGDHTAYVRNGFAHAALDDRGKRPGPRAVSSRRSRGAGTGRSRRSSSSRTTPRTGPTTWTPTAPSRSWRALTQARGVVDSSLYTTCGTAAHDRAHPGRSPDEPVRRRRFADVPAPSADARPRPYRRREAQVPTDEMNEPMALASSASSLLNLEEADRVPDIAGNGSSGRPSAGRELADAAAGTRRLACGREIPRRMSTLQKQGFGRGSSAPPYPSIAVQRSLGEPSTIRLRFALRASFRIRNPAAAPLALLLSVRCQLRTA